MMDGGGEEFFDDRYGDDALVDNADNDARAVPFDGHDNLGRSNPYNRTGFSRTFKDAHQPYHEERDGPLDRATTEYNLNFQRDFTPSARAAYEEQHVPPPGHFSRQSALVQMGDGTPLPRGEVDLLPARITSQTRMFDGYGDGKGLQRYGDTVKELLWTDRQQVENEVASEMGNEKRQEASRHVHFSAMGREDTGHGRVERRGLLPTHTTPESAPIQKKSSEYQASYPVLPLPPRSPYGLSGVTQDDIIRRTKMLGGRNGDAEPPPATEYDMMYRPPPPQVDYSVGSPFHLKHTDTGTHRIEDVFKYANIDGAQGFETEYNRSFSPRGPHPRRHHRAGQQGDRALMGQLLPAEEAEMDFDMPLLPSERASLMSAKKKDGQATPQHGAMPPKRVNEGVQTDTAELSASYSVDKGDAPLARPNSEYKAQFAWAESAHPPRNPSVGVNATAAEIDDAIRIRTYLDQENAKYFTTRPIPQHVPTNLYLPPTTEYRQQFSSRKEKTPREYSSVQQSQPLSRDPITPRPYLVEEGDRREAVRGTTGAALEQAVSDRAVIARDALNISRGILLSDKDFHNIDRSNYADHISQIEAEQGNMSRGALDGTEYDKEYRNWWIDQQLTRAHEQAKKNLANAYRTSYEQFFGEATTLRFKPTESLPQRTEPSVPTSKNGKGSDAVTISPTRRTREPRQAVNDEATRTRREAEENKRKYQEGKAVQQCFKSMQQVQEAEYRRILQEYNAGMGALREAKKEARKKTSDDGLSYFNQRRAYGQSLDDQIARSGAGKMRDATETDKGKERAMPTFITPQSAPKSAKSAQVRPKHRTPQHDAELVASLMHGSSVQGNGGQRRVKTRVERPGQRNAATRRSHRNEFVAGTGRRSESRRHRHQTWSALEPQML